MSAITTTSPSSGNTTVRHILLFPSDVNNRLLFLLRDIQFGIGSIDIFLGFVVVVSSLKSLSELALTSNSRAKTKTKDGWVVSKLKSKYAPPLIICGNGSLLLFEASLGFMLYYDVGGKTGCETIQPINGFFYVIGLWTTYMLFEVRRISTG